MKISGMQLRKESFIKIDQAFVHKTSTQKPFDVLLSSKFVYDSAYAPTEYKLKLLANRDEGYKNSYKKFIVDYNYMRISEDPNSQIIND